MPHFKKLTEKQVLAISRDVKNLLHCSRDCMRNMYAELERRAFDLRKDARISDYESYIKHQKDINDARRASFRVNDGYYGEAFGMMRTLHNLGYGDLYGQYDAHDFHNLKWWLRTLEEQVLEEEGFRNGTHHCDHCLKRWGKDGAGRTRQTHPEIANARV